MGPPPHTVAQSRGQWAEQEHQHNEQKLARLPEELKCDRKSLLLLPLPSYLEGQAVKGQKQGQGAKNLNIISLLYTTCLIGTTAGAPAPELLPSHPHLQEGGYLGNPP